MNEPALRIDEDKICPVRGELFEPCDPEELDLLIDHLKTNDTVTNPHAFPRGTMLPDGRLDLCKQCIGPEGAHRVADVVGSHEPTRHLLLGANGLGNDGAKAIAAAAARSVSLETLYLGCNLISETGATAIAHAAAENPNISALWFKRNPIGLAGARAVAAAIQKNVNLRVVDLVHTNIGADGLREIVRALREPSSGVTRLYLGGNSFTKDDILPLAEFLKTDQQLQHLYLSVNQLGDAGAIAIADSLLAHPALQTLSLSSNQIGPSGAAAVGRLLAANQTLSTVDLGYDRSTRVLGEQPNHLGDAGARALANGLIQNRGLRQLLLSHNDITDVGALNLIDALEFHANLIDLELGIRVSPARIEQVQEILERNRQHAPADAELDPHLAAIVSVYRTAPRGPNS